MNIFLIDAIGPFFSPFFAKPFMGKIKRRINWSKIPFNSFSNDPVEFVAQFSIVEKEMQRFCKKVSEVGYNSVSFDDVSHIVLDEWLEPEVNEIVSQYRIQYKRLFGICNKYGLKIYLTMDIISYTKGLKEKIGNDFQLAIQFLTRQLTEVFDSFPEVQGVIIRIGESDGKDVKGVFRSELLLKNSWQVNRAMRSLLAVAEQYNRTIVLRNWTVGAYMIGDFIWHRGTVAKALKGLESENFILSMKYGESDFFRYLPLNKHFRYQKCKKIIELQAKREYEGCGEYPSFAGWDYEKYAQELENIEGMVGMSCWCQTGGWVPFHRLSYLQTEAVWNELNSYVALRLFKYKESCEDAVTAFCTCLGVEDNLQFIEFLHLDDEVIKELLYIKELGEQKLFFRRIRIPPLLNVMWNNIFINDSVRQVLMVLVASRAGASDRALNEGRLAMLKIVRMQEIAKNLSLPVEDIHFMKDTFELLMLAREYYFLPYNIDIKEKICNAKKAYKRKYPKHIRARYRVKTTFTPSKIKRSRMRFAMQIALRRKRGYRVLDYLLTLYLLGFFYHLIIKLNPRIIPKFAQKQAMGVDTLFK